MAAEPALVPHPMTFTPVSQQTQPTLQSQPTLQNQFIQPTQQNQLTLQSQLTEQSQLTLQSQLTQQSRQNPLLHPLPSTVGTESHHSTLRDSFHSEQLLSVPLFCSTHTQLAVVAWGNNTLHQLGVASDAPTSSRPLRLAALSVPRAFPVCIRAGSCHALCLTDEAAVFAWGSNQYGQLGLGADCCDAAIPQCVGVVSGSEAKVAALENTTVVLISCGGYHSACITSDGRVLTWGHGAYGQLGQGLETTTLNAPREVEAVRGKEIVDVICGQNHTLFLSREGRVLACGNNYFGQLGLSAGVDYVTLSLPSDA